MATQRTAGKSLIQGLKLKEHLEKVEEVSNQTSDPLTLAYFASSLNELGFKEEATRYSVRL
jgi:hypothetical protein